MLLVEQSLVAGRTIILVQHSMQPMTKANSNRCGQRYCVPDHCVLQVERTRWGLEVEKQREQLRRRPKEETSGSSLLCSCTAYKDL